MIQHVRKAAVLGAGVMGSQIAAPSSSRCRPDRPGSPMSMLVQTPPAPRPDGPRSLFT